MLLLAVVGACCEWCVGGSRYRPSGASLFAGSRPFLTHPLPCLLAEDEEDDVDHARLLFVCRACLEGDESSVAAMIKAMQEQMREQMAQFEDEMNKKDRAQSAAGPRRSYAAGERR